MITAVFAIPGDLHTPTGGYRYDREVIAAAPNMGVKLVPLALPGSFPNPSAKDLAQTRAALETVPAGRPLVVDGLAFGALPESLIAAIRAPIAALVHHPLALESGTPFDRAAALKASETAALAWARAVIVTSAATARTLVADFAVPERKIVVAEPGVAPAERARGSGRRAPVALLAVGAVSARKAYPVLVEALGSLRHLDWRLTIAGALDRAPDQAASLAAAIEANGLTDRVSLLGSRTEAELEADYAVADLFVMSSLYEGYGMVLAEAMARGLPIVATTGGAAAETVPDEAALKVPPGDSRALATALARAIAGDGLRRRLAEASWAAGQSLPRWTDTARCICSVLRGLS